MIRAAKYRNRVLRKKAFLIIKGLSFPASIKLQVREKILKRSAFSSMKDNLVIRRVKRYTVKKAKAMHKAHLLKRCLISLKEITVRKRGERDRIEHVRGVLEERNKKRLMKKSIQGLKLVAYRRRVAHYLSSMRRSKVLGKFMEKIKEEFLRKKTDSIKALRA